MFIDTEDLEKFAATMEAHGGFGFGPDSRATPETIDQMKREFAKQLARTIVEKNLLTVEQRPNFDTGRIDVHIRAQVVNLPSVMRKVAIRIPEMLPSLAAEVRPTHPSS